VEEVRIDEVVETTKEDEDHTASEGGGADDRCDPVNSGRSGSPCERE
jgi:hypothetical protein